MLLLVLMCLCLCVVFWAQLWSADSWFVQFKRLFSVLLFISFSWNWLYLYKLALAEHRYCIWKMGEKYTGVRKIYWGDSLIESFRSSWQDDPCKKYEVLKVHPILLVPPTKVISFTITTFITDTLKHVGQGISEFLRALLKDLPINLHTPVLLTIVLAIVVFVYGCITALHPWDQLLAALQPEQ